MTPPGTRPPSALDRLVAAVASAQADDPFAPVTVVVPSAVARVQLRRAVGAARGLCNVSFRTWGELVAEAARPVIGIEERIPTPRVLDEALRQTLLAASSPFAAVAHSPVARAELAAMLSDLWRSGHPLIARLRELGPRAAGLVTLLDSVEQHLTSHGFVDPGRLLDAASVAPIDPALGVLVRWFPRPDRRRDRAVLAHLTELGVGVTSIDTDNADPRPLGRVIACSDPDQEARVVLRQLLAGVESGARLWSLAIVHPPSDRYRRLVHQQVAAAGIPTSGRSPTSLAETASGRTVLGLLDLADGEWRRADVMRWLAAAPVTWGPGAPRVPASRWDDISARAGVVEGLAQWRTRLSRFGIVGSVRDPYAAHSEAEAYAARSLLEFVDALAEELAAPSGGWSVWARWIGRVLDRHLNPDDRAAPWPAAEETAAREVRQALVELSELDAVGSQTDLVTFRHALEDELASRPLREDAEVAIPASTGDPGPVRPLHPGLPGPVGTGVFIGTPSEARGLVFSSVYLVGMADQFLPGSAPQSALLPDGPSGDPDWPSPERRARELLDDLVSVLELAEAPVIATRPLVDPRNGREQVPSRWLGSAVITGGQDTVVPSFQADLLQADTIPVSPPDRLLADMARWVDAGRGVERHPAVVAEPGTSRSGPLAASISAARAPLVPGFSRFEGNVGPDRARGGFGVLSATQLEDYAACPRKYLLARELKLRSPTRPEDTEAMGAKDRGSLTHEILATYVRERITEGRPASLERLLAIADQLFSVAEEEGRCGRTLMAAVERANLMRELRRFFDEDSLQPLEVELGFGGPVADEDVADDRLDASGLEGVGARAAAVDLRLSDGRVLRFGGFVDRIDRGPGDSVVVSDYKTGRQRNLKDDLLKDPVAAGTKLQLPIYGLAARAHLDHGGTVRARYWLTSWDRDVPSLVCTVDDRLLGRVDQVVSAISTGIENGVFPGVPGEETYRPGGPTFEACAYCDFDRVCPTDRDRRWAQVATTNAVEPVLELAEPPDPGLAGIVRVAELTLDPDR